jgi:hypothetical protein
MKAKLAYPIYIVLAHTSMSAVLRIERSMAYVLGFSGPSGENLLVVDTEARPRAVLTLYKGSLHIEEPGSMRYLDAIRERTLVFICLEDTSQERRAYWLRRLRPLLLLLNTKNTYFTSHKIHKSKFTIDRSTFYRLMGPDEQGLLGVYSNRCLGVSLEFEEETEVFEK